MEEFQIGDVVELKSGGPNMTVDSFARDGSIDCIWFEGSKQHEGNFKKEVLKKVDNDWSKINS